MDDDVLNLEQLGGWRDMAGEEIATPYREVNA